MIPLHFAMINYDYDSYDAVELLLSNGADPNIKYISYYREEDDEDDIKVLTYPLIEAVRYNNFYLTKLLLEHGANPNYCCAEEEDDDYQLIHKRYSALYLAQYNGNENIKNLLLSYDAKLREPMTDDNYNEYLINREFSRLSAWQELNKFC